MSRAYKFVVECYPVQDEAQLAIMGDCILDEMGSYGIDRWLDVTDRGDGCTAYFDGECSLCDGELEREANTRLRDCLKKEFPSLSRITTQWLCTEYQECYEVFTWEKNPL